jgi:RHS repeat-associated protein
MDYSSSRGAINRSIRTAAVGFVIFLGGASGAAYGARYFMSCPTWAVPSVSGVTAIVAAAAVKQFNHDYPSCPPISISCNGAYTNPTSYSCLFTYTPGGACPTPGYSATPTYQGLGAGSPIVLSDSGSPPQNHCANQISEDPKNNGGSCPATGGHCGNPINVATGNKFQPETDLAKLPGGLEFIRYYNSRAGGVLNPIGVNWTHSWVRSVTQVTGTDMRVTRPDGKVLWFVLSSGLWVGDADNPEKLQVISGGYQLTSRDDELETYDADGHLVSITARDGRTTTLAYANGTATPPGGQTVEGSTLPVAKGVLLKVTDPFGRALTFGYDINGSMVRMTDPTGGNYQYGHDATFRLTSVQYPNTTTRTYLYNESANTSGANLPHALTGILDENNQRFATFKYLSNNKAYHSEHAGGVYAFDFTYNGGTTSYTAPLGASATANVSTIVGMLQVTGTTRTCTGCGGSSTETYTFDANRNIASKKDFNGNLACYTYDTTRNLETARTEGLSGSGTCASRVTTTATRTITTDWHAALRVPRRIAEPLRITTYAYNGDTGVSCAPSGASNALPCTKTVQATTDATGSLAFTATADGAARTWTYTYNLLGKPLTVDGPRTDVTDVTTYAYYASDDPSGNYKAGDLASVTNALSQTTQLTQYDAAGRLKKTIDANGLETILDYWPRGWLKTRQVGTLSAGYETTSYDYDNVGQLTKVTLPDTSYVSYTYDAAHRLTDLQDGLGNRIHYTLDNMGNRTAEDAYDPGNTLVRNHSRVFDQLSRLQKDIGGTSPSTQINQFAYDGNGNAITLTDPLSRVTTQIFDARNRLTEVRDPFNGSGAPTRYQYNGLDQLTQVTDPSALSTTYSVNGHGETISQSSPDSGSTTFTFDAASNLKTKLDARGVTATYSYDAVNRLTSIVYPDETVTYTWDSCTNGIGRVCSITDNSGTTSYAYDVKGRVTAKTEVVAGHTFVMGYAYNSARQLSTITTPSGKSVVYTYSNNRPVSVTVDGNKVLDAVLYEPFGPNGGWHWGNSTPTVPNTHTRVFDKDFRMTRVTSDLPASGAQPYFDRQIGWDIQSRVNSMTDLANSALNATYGYDALDRITSATQGTNTWGYSYNGTGDRLTSTVNTATTNYGYTSGSHKLASLSGAQAKSYTVDAAGNMTSDGTTSWTYAGNNRATSAGAATFLLNALGQRVKKSTATTTTHFVYDEAGHLWGEYDATGALIREHIWLDDLPVGTVDAALSFVHADHLGTPRMVTRPSDNAIEWRWDNTEVFGNNAPDQNPSGLGVFAYNLRFPGQYFDSETAKHYNYFRDYDPSIGSYVESDPIGLYGGLSTYAYVKDRPLVWRDPNGLEAVMPGVGVARPGWLGDALGKAGRLCVAANPVSMLIFAATTSNRGDACSDDPSRKREECRGDCDPPEGTECSDYHENSTPHTTRDIDGKIVGKLPDHVHVYQMNKSPKGCIWNRSVTTNYTPINAKPCQGFPSWVAQHGR